MKHYCSPKTAARIKAARIDSLLVLDVAAMPPKDCARITLDNGNAFNVKRHFMERHAPKVGDMYIVDAMGQVSSMPPGAFAATFVEAPEPATDDAPQLRDGDKARPSAVASLLDSLPKKVTREALEARIKREDYIVMPDGRTTICQLTMTNGFTVRGESSCVCASEFDKALGEKYSRIKAIDRAWAFEGYLLADLRHNMAHAHGQLDATQLSILQRQAG